MNFHPPKCCRITVELLTSLDHTVHITGGTGKVLTKISKMNFCCKWPLCLETALIFPICSFKRGGFSICDKLTTSIKDQSQRIYFILFFFIHKTDRFHTERREIFFEQILELLFIWGDIFFCFCLFYTV
jgi:hypothetical protein